MYAQIKCLFCQTLKLFSCALIRNTLYKLSQPNDLPQHQIKVFLHVYMCTYNVWTCEYVCVQLYLFLLRFFHSGRLKMLLHICWHFKFQTIIPIPFVVALTATAMPTSSAAPLSFIADCSFTRSTSNKTTPTTEVWEMKRALWPPRCQPCGGTRLSLYRRCSCSCALT